MIVTSLIHALGTLAASVRPAAANPPLPLEIDLDITEAPLVAAKAMTGTWASEDKLVRLDLSANGRYDEARGTRRSAYRGRYEVDGQRLYFADDRGFTALGEVRNGVLRLGGERLTKQ